MSQGGKASFKEAQNLIKQGRLDEALVEYEKLLHIEPKNLQICYDLADLYARRGLISKVTDQYLRISDIYLGDTSLDQSIEACYRIIRLEPESIKAREKLIEIYAQMKNKDQVREQCFALSRICSMQGQSEKALEFLQKGIEVDPDNLDARLELAIMNVKQGHIKEGITQYKEVARAFWEKGELTKAADTYKRVTVLQPDDTETHLALGTLYRELGQLEDAKNAFRFILRYDLTHLKALTELGLVCQEKGEIDSAILAFRKIVDINPMKIEAREKLGELYEIRGQVQEAVKQYYAAAEDYHKEENFEKAIQMCEIILEIDCKHAKALRLMKELGYSGRPQSAPPVQAPSDGGGNIPRVPRSIPARPQSGIMMIPRGDAVPGRGRPLGPTGPRRLPFNQVNQGATMRLNENMGTHKLGPPPLRKSRNNARPLTPLKTMHDASYDPLSDTIPLHNGEPDLPPVAGDIEEAVSRMEPFAEEMESHMSPPLEEETISVAKQGLIKRGESSFPQEEETLPVTPKLITRRGMEPAEEDRAVEQELRIPETPSRGGIPSGDSLPSPVSMQEKSFKEPLYPPVEEEEPFKDNVSSIKIGESDGRDTALLAFSLDGKLEFDLEEDEIPVRTEPESISLDIPAVEVKDLDEPPVAGFQISDGTSGIKEVEDETISVSTLSASNPLPEHVVVEFVPEMEDGVSDREEEQETPHDMETMTKVTEPPVYEKKVDTVPTQSLPSSVPSLSISPSPVSIPMVSPLSASVSAPEEKVNIVLSENRVLREHRKIIESNPGDMKARNELVRSLLDLGLPGEALIEYEKILSIEKGNLDIYQKIIDVYNLLGNEDKLRSKYMELGNLYRDSNMYDSALDIYQRLISLDSNDVEAREKMADILLTQDKKKEAIYQYISVANMYTSKGQIKEVVDIYQKMLKIEPEELLTHTKLAETYAQLNMKDKAIQEYLLIAEIYLNKKLWQNAIDSYEAITRLAPDHLDAHLKLSQLYMQHGMSSKAIEANLLTIDIYLNQEKLDQAMEMAQNIIGAEPEHVLAREKLIEVYHRKGLIEKALADSQNLAEIFLKKNSSDKAIETYEKILQMEPRNYEIHYRVAELYEKKGFTSKGIHEYIVIAEMFMKDEEYEKAMEAYRKALELDQNNIEARYHLGILLSDRMNNIQAALEEFEVIRRLSPAHMDTIQRLVMGYIKTGSLQQAIQISKELKNKEILGQIIDRFKKAVDDNPDDYESRYNLGVIYKEFGDLENAIEQFQSLLKCPEKLLEAYNMLGLCFEQMGMGNLAINQFKKGLSSSSYPDEAYQELRYNLGLLYERRGMLKEAIDVYQQAYAVDIKYRDVAQRIQQLEGQLRGLS